MPDISLFLQSVKLPVMPEVAHALIRTLNDEDADVGRVRDVISKDPALTATLLRMANSAIFGLSRSVHTLDNAISVVGMSQIRARALSICMSNVFVLPHGINRLDFWRNSMVCAGYAQWLAHHAGIDEHEAWLTGMMLRLGELSIGQHSPNLIERIEARPCKVGERWKREQEFTGFSEGQITAEIARRWDFPDEVVSALQASASPMGLDTRSPLAAVVHLSGLLADMAEVTPDAVQSLPDAIVAYLRLDLEQLITSIPHREALCETSSLSV
jgi:HD-like signal output (HDOD) protein